MSKKHSPDEMLRRILRIAEILTKSEDPRSKFIMASEGKKEEGKKRKQKGLKT